MALSGLEWVIIGVVAIVIIMWGPAKIPELAKALGKAKGEFDKASKDFQETATTTANGPKIRSNDEILLETAQNLGISTAGKTREQISAEISEKVKTMGTAA
jgi:sec-independent protein translocase protein TatA